MGNEVDQFQLMAAGSKYSCYSKIDVAYQVEMDVASKYTAASRFPRLVRDHVTRILLLLLICSLLSVESFLDVRLYFP